MAKDFDSMEDSNPSSAPTLHDLSRPSRRTVLGGLGVALGGLLAPLGGRAASGSPLLGFGSVAPSSADRVIVPEGYIAEVVAAWGDPVGLAGVQPAFRFDASNTAAEQEAQLGMHHDGMQYFALDGGRRGLLVTNHEYTDDGLLHPDGMKTWTAEKVRKSQAAHGVSVIEVQRMPDGHWQPVRPSRFARRITARTPMRIAGPAAGHALLRTAADPGGTRVLGTLNNCGCGITPWGTYLTCEENFAAYFNGPQQPNDHERRWGLRKGGAGFRWHEFDERFDATLHPNEPHRFGWVVEIDPHDPSSTPVKRTALGRGANEAATVAVTRDGRAVVYSGEDARYECIYRFVSRDPVRRGGARANADLLDHGTLSVARFDADGTGEWVPLRHGTGPLAAGNGFADQGEVLVKRRQASDAVAATRMDRPEWIAVDHAGWVYCSLTNNSARGAAGQLPPDAANPRAGNTMGHIIRWKEDGDFDGARFRWNHFVLAGDPSNARAEAKGNVQGDAFGSPDSLWVDSRGVLWIQTDGPSGRGDYQRLGNNAMLAADVQTGEVRRFLVGPLGCEIAGATGTPDGRTMFVNMQHPNGNWPDHRPDGRPRSATVVIRKADGGVIGT